MAIIKIRLPDDWVPHIDADAGERDEVQAEWLREAIRARLSKERRKNLSVPRGRGAPKKGGRE